MASPCDQEEDENDEEGGDRKARADQEGDEAAQNGVYYDVKI